VESSQREVIELSFNRMKSKLLDLKMLPCHEREVDLAKGESLFIPLAHTACEAAIDLREAHLVFSANDLCVGDAMSFIAEQFYGIELVDEKFYDQLETVDMAKAIIPDDVAAKVELFYFQTIMAKFKSSFR